MAWRGTLPGSSRSFALDINDRGTVVGYCTDFEGQPNVHRAFVWQNGQMTDLHLNQPSVVNGYLLLAGNAVHQFWDMSDPYQPFVVKDGKEARTNRFGTLEVTPTEKPVENILFHDGTNLSIERQMAELAETGAMHDLVAQLLRRNFEGIRKAIRGSVG